MRMNLNENCCAIWHSTENNYLAMQHITEQW